MARRDNAAPGTSGQKVQKSSRKYRRDSDCPRPSERLRQEGEQAPPTGGAAPKDKKQARSERRVEQTGEKLDKARDKLSKQKPSKKPGPIKSAGRVIGYEAHTYIHGKIYQVEQDNVGVEAAHKAELAGESLVGGGARLAKRHLRTRPARQVRKWERKHSGARADHELGRLAREHPEANKSALSRLWQKQKLKWKYQKQTRETTRRTAKAAKKTAETSGRLLRHLFKVL